MAPPAPGNSNAASKSKTRSGGGSARMFSREEELVKELQDAVTQSQLHDACLLADVNLICNGGVVPVHGILLQSASPFFEKCFESQGQNYLVTRDISLPDFTLSQMRKVVQLLYTGSVTVSSKEEAELVTDTLTALEFERVSAGELSCKKLTKDTPKSDDVKIRFKSGMSSMKRAKSEVLALRDGEERPLKKKKKNKEKRNYIATDSDYEPDIDDEKNKGGKKVAAVVKNKNKGGNKNGGGGDSDESDWEEPNYNDKRWFDREARRCQFCKKEHENPAQASMCITGHQRLRCYFCFRVCKNTEKLFEHFKNQHKQAGRENCLLCPYCEQTIPFKSVSCHVISLHLSDMRAGGKNDDRNKNGPSTSAATITVPYRPRTGPGRPQATNVTTANVVQKATAILEKNMVCKVRLPKITTKAKNTGDGGNKRKQNDDGNSNGKKKPRLLKDNELEITLRNRPKSKDDGMMRVSNLDYTIRRKGLFGKIWSWRLQKKIIV